MDGLVGVSGRDRWVTPRPSLSTNPLSRANKCTNTFHTIQGAYYFDYRQQTLILDSKNQKVTH